MTQTGVRSFLLSVAPPHQDANHDRDGGICEGDREQIPVEGLCPRCGRHTHFLEAEADGERVPSRNRPAGLLVSVNFPFPLTSFLSIYP